MYWPAIEIVKDHHTVVVDGFVMAFFLNASHADLIAGVQQCLRRYVEFVGWRSVPFYVTDNGDVDPLDEAVLRHLVERGCHVPGEDGVGSLTLLGSDTGVSAFEFHYYGRALPVDRWPDYRNLLYCRLPRSLVLEAGFDAIKALMVDMAATLPTSFAYANPALLYNHDIGEATFLAMKHPGFDVLLLGSVTMALGNRAAGVYWLSLCGAELTQALGGLPRIRASLPAVIEVEEPRAGHALIRLGPEPEVGDVNRRTEFPLHRELAKLLAPVLHVPVRTYFADRDNESDREAMLRWHGRFL